MSKWSLINRLLQMRLTTCVCIILCVIAVHQLIAASSSNYNYSHIPVEAIDSQLYKQITSTLRLEKTKPDCKYDELLNSKETIEPREITEKIAHFNGKGLDNGSYVPSHCNPVFSVAILVTYRNRQKQLDILLPYLHEFLRKQNIHYKIFVIEQEDEKPWNKGVLYNIGAKQAIKEGFPCLILHDVDLLPLDASNLYACMNEPRHLSASIDKLRYVLLYDTLVGGVLAIRTDQYVTVDGFSNRFEKWGAEDDDLERRLTTHKLNIVRFPRQMSRYTMLVHRAEPRNALRYRVLAENAQRTAPDGLTTLPHHTARIKNHRQATFIAVKL